VLRFDNAKPTGTVQDPDKKLAPSAPAGLYKRKVSELIGERWSQCVKQNRDQYRLGAVDIGFQIDRAGKQKNIRTISNTSNRGFLAMCIRCVKEAKFPAPPPCAFKTDVDEALDITFNFKLY